MSAWKKATGSGSTNACVELSRDGRVRDSKNPAVTLDARELLAWVKRFTVTR